MNQNWIARIAVLMVFFVVGTVKAQQSTTPGMPSLNKMYEGNGVRFLFPDGWQYRHQSGQLIFFPLTAPPIRLPGKGEFFTHALFVGAVQDSDLSAATDQILLSYRRSNPGTQVIEGTRRSQQIAGREALTVEMVNPSSPLGPEQDLLVTVADGQRVLFWFMGVPTREFDSYRGTFSKIIDSIRFTDDAGPDNPVSSYQPPNLVAPNPPLPPLLEKAWNKLNGNGMTLKTDDPDRPTQKLQLHLHVSDQPVVNAWTALGRDDVYITKALLDLIGPSEGELAFVLAHEIGHQIDHRAGLDTLELQQRGPLDELRALFMPRRENNRVSQAEETRADNWGFSLLVFNGYNPYDAAAFFGRLQMAQGTTDPATRQWDKYLKDHPFNEDRIENLRRIMAAMADQKKKAM